MSAVRMRSFELTSGQEFWILFVLPVISLLAIGALMVFSASLQIAETRYGSETFFIYRHGLYLAMAAAASFVVWQLPMETWKTLSPYLLVLSLMLLMVVLIPGVGRTVNGSTRWIGIGGITMQPSEIAKFSMVLYLATYIEKFKADLANNWRVFARPIVILSIMALLLLMEPDFGTTVVLGFTVVVMLFLAGSQLKPFALMSFVGLIGISVIATVSPYRVKRLIAFMDPWAHQFDSGYQLTQSLIAFGRGGFLGQGIGQGVQKLFYLPEGHTDFVFAVIGEETGLLGVLSMIGLYAVVMIFLLLKGRALASVSVFGGFVLIGTALLLAVQALINMAVAMGSLPTKGITLPLVSYGGSSLVMTVLLLVISAKILLEELVATSSAASRKRINRGNR